MRPDSRHAKAPGLRPRIFASPQTTDARWLPIHRYALSSTHRWRDPARQRRRIAAILFSSSLYFLLSRAVVRNGRFARDTTKCVSAAQQRVARHRSQLTTTDTIADTAI